MKLRISSLIGLGLLATSLGVLAWTVDSLGLKSRTARNSAKQDHADLVLLLGDNPFKIEPDPMRVDVPWDSVEQDRYVGYVADPVDGEPEESSRSRKLHAARLLSQLGTTPEWLVRDRTAFITHVRLPNQTIWYSWRGLEMAESPEGRPTEHRDQTLAALAESQVPLSAVINLENGTFHVYDLLRTSLHEFDLNQEEISWTATTYACYLPPQTTWRNRFGEQYSFDDLVEEIIRRPCTRESCGGTHMVMALTKLVKVDRELHILSAEVRGRLIEYLRNKLFEAVSTQFTDGSWPLSWSPSGFVAGSASFTPAETDIARITVTGHLIEWFHLLPSGMKPPARSVETGTLWIQSKLRSSSKMTITENFCPYTHAIVCLNLAARSATQ